VDAIPVAIRWWKSFLTDHQVAIRLKFTAAMKLRNDQRLFWIHTFFSGPARSDKLNRQGLFFCEASLTKRLMLQACVSSRARRSDLR
jgi:hypothetical protein